MPLVVEASRQRPAPVSRSLGGQLERLIEVTVLKHLLGGADVRGRGGLFQKRIQEFQETETWSTDHDPFAGTRVLYVPGSAQLHAPRPPGELLFPIKEKALRGVAVPIPGESKLVVSALEFVDDRERTIEVMNELLDGWWPEHWVLGASVDVQGRRVLRCLTGSSGRLPKPCAVPARRADGQGWTLLAQINEDVEADIGIGDGGSFYLYILEQDLRERRFDRVVGLMQCH